MKLSVTLQENAKHVQEIYWENLRLSRSSSTPQAAPSLQSNDRPRRVDESEWLLVELLHEPFKGRIRMEDYLKYVSQVYKTLRERTYADSCYM